MLKKLEAIVGATGCAVEEFKASIGPLRGKPSVDEAVALFRANPLRWFRDARGHISGASSSPMAGFITPTT